MELILGLVSLAIALFALFLSWKAYRQRERYHPQPKLVVEWEGKIEPVKDGLFIRKALIWNHGDAAARDVHLNIDSAIPREGASWEFEVLLEPGRCLRVQAPLVDRVTRGESAEGWLYDRAGAKEDYRFVTPTLTVGWRQAPFDQKPKAMNSTAPTTPDLGFGRGQID